MVHSIFSCPVCSLPLYSKGRTYNCSNNHVYDISKEGYVNLLLANMKHSREPGDSKEMLDARRLFLNRGYYRPLAEKVTSLTVNYKEQLQDRDIVILDAGCGEGYYTDYISKDRHAGKSSIIYGIDISREGIRSAAKRNSSVQFAVAGIYKLPVLDSSVDILINIFAPFNEAEFGRVLKENGLIISVAPGAGHLYEMKQKLYDEAYSNDEAFEISDKFKISEIIRVQYELSIKDNADIFSLLKMTPYYHKTGPDKINLFLNNIKELKTSTDFVIRVIKKNNR